MNFISLFAGIGGLDLGLERAGMTTVGQVELDPYCRNVLAKHWPEVPRHDDVRTAADWWLGICDCQRERVDVICGGFPCQDISVAGRRAGILDGERSGLWSYMADTIRRIRPSYVIVENVPRILARGLDGAIPAEIVAADLAAIGYDLRWDCLPASTFGAPHRRDRWFGIAYPHSDAVRLESVAQPWGSGEAFADVHGRYRDVANPHGAGLEGRRVRGSASERGPRAGELPYAASVGRGQRWPGGSAGGGEDGAGVWPQALADTEGLGRGALGQESAGQGWPDDFAGHAGQRRRGHAWSVEPDVGRVADGVPARVDRLRALGNAVVPQVAEYVGRLIVDHASVAA